jgi:hypothetical protein
MGIGQDEGFIRAIRLARQHLAPALIVALAPPDIQTRASWHLA